MLVASQWIFLISCLAAIATDFLFRRVFNWLIVLLLAVKLALMLSGVHIPAVLSPAWRETGLGLLLALVFLVPLYGFRMMGAGDVKYFAVLGCWLGPEGLLPVWLLGSVAAGVHALVVMTCRAPHIAGVLAQGSTLLERAGDFAAWRRMRDWRDSIRQGRRGIPYAAYLAAAALIYVFLQ